MKVHRSPGLLLMISKTTTLQPKIACVLGFVESGFGITPILYPEFDLHGYKLTPNMSR